MQRNSRLTVGVGYGAEADLDDCAEMGLGEDHAEQPGVQQEPIPVPVATGVVRLDKGELQKIVRFRFTGCRNRTATMLVRASRLHNGN